ncbi:MAG: DUF983 domain-containing protein [Flavobacteriales bacterium]|nr:DUF983 domain-containing protein [Flavobacteriales bacterium]
MASNQVMRVLQLKCPRCGEGEMFCNKNVYQYKGFFDMPKECPHCHQDFRVEPGFYYGAMYVSYALTIAVTVAVFATMSLLDLFSIGGFLITDIVVLLITLPYIFKVSRSFWLMLMVKPEKNTSASHE